MARYIILTMTPKIHWTMSYLERGDQEEMRKGNEFKDKNCKNYRSDS